MAKRKTDGEGEKGFNRKNLDSSILAMPLIEEFEARRELKKKGRKGTRRPLQVIIDLNLLHPGGRDSARRAARKILKEVLATVDADEKGAGLDAIKSKFCPQYLFAELTPDQIIELVRRDRERGKGKARSVYKIWPDFEVEAHLTQSVSTIKADAARAAFQAAGEGQVWAVIDSGIDGDHDHFKEHDNLALREPISHHDFTGRARSLKKPTDDFGHGTHVAGIIAGEVPPLAERRRKPAGLAEAGDSSAAEAVVGEIHAAYSERDDAGDVTYSCGGLDSITGVAPRCNLVSLKVLNERGKGPVSNVLAALGYILTVNDRWRHIHGVNLSVGYEFDAEWFACGQSPLCVEVNRVVRSGVVVVVAAGNTGYGTVLSDQGQSKTGLDLTINDPGNAELAITVGATHRSSPHIYGVSYFSSKGPTGDGRPKPDLVAPGEKVLSCAAGAKKGEIRRKFEVEGQADHACQYRQESGTSMAAPHVAGAIAAFLSLRREFIGHPLRVKEIFLSTATDLKRERYFQGHGLVDLMRAIQSV